MNSKKRLQKAVAIYEREKRILGGGVSKNTYQNTVVAYLARIEEHLNRILERQRGLHFQEGRLFGLTQGMRKCNELMRKRK